MRYRIELLTDEGRMNVTRYQSKGYTLPLLTALAALYPATARLIARDTRNTKVLASMRGTQS